MEMNNRFKEGDKVWFVDTNLAKEWVVAGSFIVSSYRRTVWESEGFDLTEYFATTIYIADYDIFATEEEAQAECDRRNNGK